MKLSELEDHIKACMAKAVEEGDDLPIDPEIVFSVGKPTDKKILQINGMGTAMKRSGQVDMFISLEEQPSIIEDMKKMMTEILGEEHTQRIFDNVDERMAEADDLDNMEPKGHA